MSQPILEVRDLIKIYNLYPTSKDKLKSLFRLPHEKTLFYALNGINLSINEGESIGVIGLNGSGKSTFSNIIAGLSPSTSGDIIVNGSVSLLSIATGLNNELTGRENIELKCLMLGLNKKEIKSLEPEIIDFSELGNYIDQPVKQYSSGMKSRLGFSISSALNPDVFIVDEALSVGDSAFTEKSIDRMMEFKNNGKSIIYVSHSLSQIKKFCNKVLWIEAGRVKSFGQTEEVLRYYNKFMEYWKKLSSNEKKLYKEKAYTVPIRKVIDNEKLFLYDLGIEQFNWITKNEKIKNFFSSRVVSFKSNKTRIYKQVENQTSYEFSKKYMNQTFFSKKSAHYKGEVYLLLSNKQSYEESLLGWVNIKDLNHFELTFISDTKKKVNIKDSAKVYKKPLGGFNDENTIILKSEKNTSMNVKNSYLINKKFLWYEGEINDEYIWVDSTYTTR